jgi:hypothetical protein
MASPAITPEPRATFATRLGLALAVVLPLVLVAYTMASDGWLSDTHGAFLHRVHFALERGRLELLGFEYPPLPFLLLVPWATITTTWIIGGVAVAILAMLVVDECTDRRSVLPLILLVSALWTPIGLHLLISDFNEAVGLLALFLGWRHYRKWWATRQTVHGLYTGLWLGLAFYTSPLGLAVALIAGAVLPLIFPRLQIPPFASQLVLLVFPGFAAAATWAYLSWVFVGHVELPFRPWESNSPLLGTMLIWSVPYLLVAALVLLRPKASTAGMLLPLGLLWVANRIGWHFSVAFAVVLLTLVAIVALPRELKLPTRALLGTVAIGQAIIAWMVWPIPSLTEADLAARAVAEALADAPPRTVLIDDRFSLSLFKWSPSLEPYLTTRDTGFEVAISQPLNTVLYVLATPDRDGLTMDADIRPPAGFLPTWSWRGYSLWRHPNAPTPVLKFNTTARVSK